MISRIALRLLLACGLWAASTVQAATKFEVINGATCTPYPLTAASYRYQHWLVASNYSAHCHLTMSGDWPVNTLSYVLFNTVSSGVLRARLCVHDGHFTATCSSDKIISAVVSWVAVPSPMPPYASGAFVEFIFPPGENSFIRELVPVWNK